MKKAIVAIIFVIWVHTGYAMDISVPDSATQNEFKDFVKEVGYALTFNPMAPAEPLNITGFDISLEVVATDISDSKGYWKTFIDGTDVDTFLPVPRLHVQKGLPMNIDIGAIYASVPDSNIKLWGIEAKWALLEGTVATPALALRGSYSQLSGVDDIDLNTMSADILVSKGLLMFTPYAGASVIRVSGSENNPDVDLDDENELLYKLLGGVQYSPFPLLILNLEVSFGEVMQYGIKGGLRF
ncbi:MAG: hypothetical protein KJ737_19190 [Proteobacteria bacterium]|nr:hypothetical protein [Pseudomonadota bacterium]